MKRSNLFVAILSLALCLSAKADHSVFGNQPDGHGKAYDVAWYNYMSSGGEVAFTPSQNISVSSVTLWLQNYTGQNGLTLDAAIYSNFQNAPGNVIDSLNSPSPNDGSAAAFNFCSSSGPTTLDAGQEYWLLVYANGTNPMEPTGCMWEEGGSPSGNAAYNGSQGFSEPYSDTPAFSINAVPEPGVGTLTCVGLFLVMFRSLRKRAKSRLMAQRFALAPSRNRRRQCGNSTKLKGF